MNTTKMSKKFTPVKFGLFILTVLMTLPTYAELGAGETVAAGGGAVVMSDHQFDRQMCSQGLNDTKDAYKEFRSACSEAGMGRNECVETIRECREDDAKDKEKCLNFALTTDDVEKTKDRVDEAREQIDEIRDKIEDKRADLEETRREAVSLARKKDEAKAQLEATMSDIGNQRTQALRNEVEQMEKISMEVENIQNQIQMLELDLNKFVVGNELECRKQAQEYKQNVYSRFVANARAGKARYSQDALFSATGLSAKDIAGLKADRKLRQCTALSLNTPRGQRRTAFGSQYQLKLKEIAMQKQLLQKNIMRLNQQRDRVKQTKADTLAQLSRQEQRTLSTHTNTMLRLDQEGQLLKQKETRATEALRDLEMERMVAMSEKSESEEQLQRQYGSEILASGDDKREAFINAMRAFEETQVEAENYTEAQNSCEGISYAQNILNELSDSETGLTPSFDEDGGLAEVDTEETGDRDVASDDDGERVGETIN